MLKYQAMVDIETMGTGPNSAICSIGVVKWLGSEEHTFYRRVSLISSQRIGGWIDASTVLWWLKQSEVARNEIQSGEDLPVVLLALTEFLKDCKEIWAGPASFDLPIIEHAYHCCSLPLPWHFSQCRCWLTIRKTLGMEKEQNSAEHHALSDAKAQLAGLRKALERLSK